MPKEVQFRRGTSEEHSVFIGAEGELTIDTDKNIAVVHDGSTIGGFDLVGVAATQQIYNKTSVGIGTTVPRSNLHVEGTVYVTGVSTFVSDVDIKNNYNLYFGDNREGSIRFDGDNFIISENGSGGLSLRGSNVLFQNLAGNTRYLEGIDGQEVSLYYNNVKRLDTTGVGATVFGDFGLTQDLHVSRNSRTVGVSTVGILTVSQDANVSRDLIVDRDAQVSGMLTVGTNTVSGTVTAGQVFTSPGTWTKPGNLKMIKVTVVAGGGGGGGARGTAPPTSVPRRSAGGGGGGGSSIRWIPAPTIPGPVAVTRGAGGAGSPAPGSNGTTTAGSAGQTSSFGSFLSATGGGGSPGNSGGAGGVGSGGDINLNGGGGGGATATNLTSSGQGGNTILGGGGASVSEGSAGASGGNYGGGGSGGSAVSTTGRAGGAGAGGIVIVEEFY